MSSVTRDAELDPADGVFVRQAFPFGTIYTGKVRACDQCKSSQSEDRVCPTFNFAGQFYFVSVLLVCIDGLSKLLDEARDDLFLIEKRSILIQEANAASEANVEDSGYLSEAIDLHRLEISRIATKYLVGGKYEQMVNKTSSLVERRRNAGDKNDKAYGLWAKSCIALKDMCATLSNYVRQRPPENAGDISEWNSRFKSKLQGTYGHIENLIKLGKSISNSIESIEELRNQDVTKIESAEQAERFMESLWQESAELSTVWDVEWLGLARRS